MSSISSNPPEVGTGAVCVESLRDSDRERWDAFVESCPDATFFHLSGWKTVIERVFGYRTWFLFAERDGRITGVVPIGQVKSWLFGNALISTPFCVYGGIAAGDSESAAALRTAAVALADSLAVDYLELRQRTTAQAATPDDALYVTFRRAIEADDEANMKAIPRKQRAMVRKGIKAGLRGEIETGVDRFFGLYSESVRNLGTPVMPRRWFEAIKDVFGERCEVLTIVHEGTPVSSVMSYYFRDEVLPYYGGGGAGARAFKANDFMYWELMCRAAARGVRVFDYGRSKVGSGSFSFKKNWGFTPEPLGYEYHLVRAGAPPSINPTNPKYKLMIETWRRLPLTLSRMVGPMIARYLG